MRVDHETVHDSKASTVNPQHSFRAGQKEGNTTDSTMSAFVATVQGHVRNDCFNWNNREKFQFGGNIHCRLPRLCRFASGKWICCKWKQ